MEIDKSDMLDSWKKQRPRFSEVTKWWELDTTVGVGEQEEGC